MSRAGGLFSRIFRGIFAPRPKNARIVGEDHLGNTYYEAEADGTSRRGSRWVEARGQEDPQFIPDVPPEWDAWLRRRRNIPPSQEELDRNYAMMVRTQRRAKELEDKEGMANSPEGEGEADQSYTETVTEDSFKSKFPQYKGFEVTPGQFKKKKDK
ncbi:NADH dehydrogenase [ubiquinone] 1 alpha subcomplex assembly factor 2-like [Babylonia areolata]|uniref:NADH dehydrogenase [ubiquinone] 1 alpha subcomplex assembly factor 2-like n=1 Tax=Babylonia areolata TaxID=304850 RepID=UPI003FCFD8B8